MHECRKCCRIPQHVDARRSEAPIRETGPRQGVGQQTRPPRLSAQQRLASTTQHQDAFRKFLIPADVIMNYEFIRQVDNDVDVIDPPDMHDAVNTRSVVAK